VAAVKVGLRPPVCQSLVPVASYNNDVMAIQETCSADLNYSFQRQSVIAQIVSVI